MCLSFTVFVWFGFLEIGIDRVLLTVVKVCLVSQGECLVAGNES